MANFALLAGFFGSGATIRIGREILCLAYAGLFFTTGDGTHKIIFNVQLVFVQFPLHNFVQVSREEEMRLGLVELVKLPTMGGMTAPCREVTAPCRQGGQEDSSLPSYREIVKQIGVV